MAFTSSVRQFPIVKVITLTALDTEKEKLSETAFAGMVASAMISLEDMESLWKIDHDALDLKDKFQQLHYQLDSLKKCCEIV